MTQLCVYVRDVCEVCVPELLLMRMCVCARDVREVCVCELLLMRMCERCARGLCA